MHFLHIGRKNNKLGEGSKMDTQVSTLGGREASSESISSLSFAPVSSIDNGSFETADFEGWSTIGDTSIETDDLGIFPTNGTYQALITTEIGRAHV